MPISPTVAAAPRPAGSDAQSGSGGGGTGAGRPASHLSIAVGSPSESACGSPRATHLVGTPHAAQQQLLTGGCGDGGDSDGPKSLTPKRRKSFSFGEDEPQPPPASRHSSRAPSPHPNSLHPGFGAGAGGGIDGSLSESGGADSLTKQLLSFSLHTKKQKSVPSTLGGSNGGAGVASAAERNGGGGGLGAGTLSMHGLDGFGGGLDVGSLAGGDDAAVVGGMAGADDGAVVGGIAGGLGGLGSFSAALLGADGDDADGATLGDHMFQCLGDDDLMGVLDDWDMTADGLGIGMGLADEPLPPLDGDRIGDGGVFGGDTDDDCGVSKAGSFVKGEGSLGTAAI
ncbi:unnamed protein product [Phaeothamnion confervicola]